jgi:hypothetical protein
MGTPAAKVHRLVLLAEAVLLQFFRRNEFYVVLILLGIYLDWIEILLIVLPVFYTVFQNLDLGGHVAKNEQMFWFAILLAVNLQNSFLSPPFCATLFYLKGTPAASPTIPQVNPESQVEGLVILVPALATAPSGVTTENIYLNNAEWAVTFSGTGTGNADSTTNPDTGTKAVELTSVANQFRVRFRRATTLDLSTLTDPTLGIRLDLKAAYSSSQNLELVFLDAANNPVSNVRTLAVNKALLDYQFIGVNLSEFTFTSQTIQAIEIIYRQRGGGTHAGLWLDNLKIQGGVTQPVSPGGSAGEKGWSPILSVVTDGARRVLQVSDWTGGAGAKPATGQYIGASGLTSTIGDAVDIRGAGGINGNDGWTPIFAVVTDGERRVLQVVDWTGSTGTKPTTGLYVGSDGLKVNIADGVDIRGATGPAGSGGGGGTTGRTLLTGFAVIPFDKEYYYSHEMAGPVEISVNTTLPRSIPNNTILYVKANGTDKPTFKSSDNFSILFDGWNNTAGEWNRILLEWSPQGNPVVQIMDTSGTTNPGTGATVITLTFDEDDSFTHVITGTVSLAVDTTGAQVAKRVIGWFQANGTNKPMWSSPIEANFDNYVNTAGVWNRFYLEWTPENKVTLQIQNT